MDTLERFGSVLTRLVEHTEQLARRMAELTDAVTAATEQQGASTQEMAAAAGVLLKAAEKLRGLVRGFRI